MTLDKDTIKLAQAKKFTEFSKSIKDVLVNKMADHPISKSYSDEVNYMHRTKDQFKEISSEE
jgi:hypothetical protein